FSSERKLMSAIYEDQRQADSSLVFTKGAPDALLGRCSYEHKGEEARPLTEARRAEILRCADELAAEALRTLGVADRRMAGRMNDANEDTAELHLIFAGLIGMIDPPREEAKSAVARAKGAGVRPIMITGDHPITASVIAKELGIADNGRAMTGSEIDRLSE